MTKCTDELTLLMAIFSDGNYLTPRRDASDLAHLYDDFWPRAFAGVINDGWSGRLPRRPVRESAIRAAGQFRRAPPPTGAHKQRGRGCHDAQRHDLLPIHAPNITAFSGDAKWDLNRT